MRIFYSIIIILFYAVGISCARENLTLDGTWSIFVNQPVKEMAVTKDFIWVTDNLGNLTRINKTDKINSVVSWDDSLKPQDITNLKVDPYGKLWMVCAKSTDAWHLPLSWIVTIDGASIKRIILSPKQIIYHFYAFDFDNGLWYRKLYNISPSISSSILRMDTRTGEDIVSSGLFEPAFAFITHDNVLWAKTANLISVEQKYWKDEDSFSNNMITYKPPFEINGMAVMAEGTDGFKWFGYQYAADRGIARYDGKTWKLYTEADGLPNNSINALAVDKKGALWAATFGSLSRFDGQTWTTYTTENSTPLMGTMNSIFVDDDDTLWFNSNSGVINFRYKEPVSIKEKSTLPISLQISGIYPNPFNSSTTITFTLPSSGFATISIYSLTGQRVRTLVSGDQTAGTHSVIWNGRDDSGKTVSSGVYLSRLQMGEKVAVGRMLLLK